MLASDERRVRRRLGLAHAALRLDGAPDGDRLDLALRRDRLEWVEGDRTRRCAHGVLVDDHRADGGCALESSGGVDDIARDDPLASLGSRTEGDDRLAGRDGGPNRDLEPFVAELPDRLQDAESRPHGPLGVVLVGDGGSEDGHDCVADELLDSAVEALDVGLHALVVRAERRSHVLRVGAIGTAREADEVDEQDRDDLALLSGRSICLERLAARQAEARALRVLFPARGADDHATDLRSDPARRLRSGRKRLLVVLFLLVLRKPAVEDAAGEDADETVVLVDDRHALGVLGLEEAERLVELDVGADRVVRLLGDVAERRRARVLARRDHLADERLAGDDADEPLLVRDVDRAHLGPLQELARRLRGSGRPGAAPAA